MFLYFYKRLKESINISVKSWRRMMSDTDSFNHKSGMLCFPYTEAAGLQ